MALLGRKEIDYYAPLLKKLEEEEPVVAAWRYHIRTNESFNNKHYEQSLKNKIKSVLFRLKKIQLPQRKQIVFLMTSKSPSASDSLIPLITEVISRKEKPYVVVSSKTENIELSGVDKIKINHLSYHFTDFKKLKNLEDKAKELCDCINKVVNQEHKTDWVWIFEGLLAKEAARFLSGASFVVADSDKESIRKGFFIGTQNCGIKSTILQHGLFDKLLFPIHSFYHFDWGPYFSKKAAEFGHPLERAVSLGCPRFDVIENLKSLPKEKNFFDRFNLKSRPVVLAISNVHVYDIFSESVKTFFENVNLLIDNGVSVIIRRHPAETNKDIYLKFMGEKRIDKCGFADANENLYEIMRNCDLVYHFASASSIEAMLFGIPVLWQENAEGNPFKDIPLLGGGVNVTSKDIVDVVKELGKQGNERIKVLERQEGFLSQAVVNRGKAAQKMVDFINMERERE